MREKFAIANLRAKRANYFFFFFFCIFQNSPPPPPQSKRKDRRRCLKTLDEYICNAQEDVTYESKHVIIHILC